MDGPGRGLLHHRRQRRLRLEVPRRGARRTKKPLFLYVAFNAPHAPLQPLQGGLREIPRPLRRRLGRRSAPRASPKQTKLGLFGKDVEALPAPRPRPRLGQLSTDDAATGKPAAWPPTPAMIDRVDQELGRLVADLEKARRTRQHAHPLLLRQRRLPLRPPPDRAWTASPIVPDVDLERQHRLGLGAQHAVPLLQAEPVRGRHLPRPAIVHWPAGLKTKPGSHRPRHRPTCRRAAHPAPNSPAPTSPTEWPGRELDAALRSLARPDPRRRTAEQTSAHPPALLHRSRSARRRLETRQLPQPAVGTLQHRHRPHRTPRPRGQHPEIVERMSTQWHGMPRTC